MADYQEMEKKEWIIWVFGSRYTKRAYLRLISERN